MNGKPLSGVSVRRVIVAAVVGALAALPAQVAHARVPVDADVFATAGVEEQIMKSVDSDELRDMKLIAEQYGLSLDESIAQYGWHNDFSEVVTAISEYFPAAFTDAQIVGAQHARVGFKGQIPGDARSLLQQFKDLRPFVTVEVQENRGYSERELEIVVAEVHYAIFDSQSVRNAVTTYDGRTLTITTRVVLKDEAHIETEDVLAALSRDALRGADGDSYGFSANVVISPVLSLGGDDSASYHYGGEVLSGCTSGFATRASSPTSGTRGIATAGHCNNSQSDDGYALTFKAEHQSTHGDFQWHTGPQAYSNKFYAGSAITTETNLTSVTATAAPVVGQSLCKNGATNHASCQGVRKLAVCKDSRCNLVQMGARLAAPGDSGGPIYLGTKAYGIHQGWMYDPVWPFDRDLFSRADRIDNALGIWIATN